MKYREWLTELNDIFMSMIGKLPSDVDSYNWKELYDQENTAMQAYDIWAESNPEFFHGV